MSRLVLTERAIDDLLRIEAYSIARWGKAVADRYIGSFQAAFDLLRESPELLKARSDFSGRLRFYRVERHWLVCDLIEDAVVILTIAHGAMDLPARLAELEPSLAAEAELLFRGYTEGHS